LGQSLTQFLDKKLHLMTHGTDDLDNLIALLAKLPGLGPRSARRAVLHLIKKRSLVLIPLAETMHRVGATARECLNCGNVGTTDVCDICTTEKRGTGQICIVEDVADLWAMERSGVFKGRYHVLGGTLSALDAVGPDELRIPKLIDRVQSEGITEVILALGATIDGQTTAHYIADQLHGVTVTSLAQGVPVGGELDYLDDGTITAALNARRAL
jgi:recombination protein RecR